ncbi:MAG: site-2 protease family protein [Clostridia bacterium]|nr:site-2 protease family protein [Clostridia bacterium]
MTVLYVFFAILMFGLFIILHELGHFLMARLFGVGINEFSIGMGPKIFSKQGKKYDTKYSLRAFPIGGYVSMVGEDEECDDPTAFHNKPAWQRILIVAAGPVINVLLGFLLMLVVVLGTSRLASNVIGDFDEGAMSLNHGLQVGDKVIEVGGVNIHTGNELVYEIMNQGVAESSEGVVAIDLTVERNGEEIFLPGVQFPSMETEGVLFGSPDFRVYGEEKSFASVIRHTFFRSISTVKMIIDQLVDLIGGRYGLNAVSGPIGITQEVVNVAKTGFFNVLYLMTVITVNLGVFNLLPLPALDGGRLIFLLIELVARRPINKNIEGYIHFAGMILLFGLMIVIFCKDFIGLFI